MDEDEEINIMGDPNFLNCDYTVHPQWLLDKPSTNPDCWYNNSISRSREDSDQEPIGHITTENSITDESGWTEKEKTLLERGIEIFGKSPLRLSQFIGSKTPSEIKYYLKSFYMELHPTHFVRNAVRKLSDDFAELGNILIDSQIPCTSEQIVEVDIQNEKSKRKRKVSTSKEIVGRSKMKLPVQKQRSSKFNIIPNKQRDVKGKNQKVHSVISKNIGDSAHSNININRPTNSNFMEGEIVIMKKPTESSDSEVEVDVEDECEDVRTNSHSDREIVTEKKVLNEYCAKESENSSEFEENAEEDEQLILNQLSSLDIPRSEVKLEKNSISPLEKFVFAELFPSNIGITEKTTEEYLKFRNHIVFTWNYKKPNYLTKGDIQKGFKPSVRPTLCKIHNFLEQIGVINYGCGRVRYIRPMHKIFKNLKMKMSTQPRRFKKKFLYNGEGGCTVSHGAHGEIIETTVINEDPVPSKTKQAKIKPTYLINCKPFSKEYRYKVKLHVSTLLLMDFHAHSALSEVMGLVGGSWSPASKLLTITHYEPCKNLASSTTHCDMCPVSQAESAERINDMRLHLLGWFHSHPTFAPEPSQQDLDTQKGLQEWIGAGKPCVGVILSPFNRPTALTPSEYRCMIVDKLEGDDRFLPYKFKVEIVSDNFNLDGFVENMTRIRDFVAVNRISQDEKFRIDFKQPYMHDKSMTYLEKFVSSARMTLERYFSEQMCMKIVKGIKDVCRDCKT